jgi:hypothetical protein
MFLSEIEFHKIDPWLRMAMKRLASSFRRWISANTS